MDGILAPTKCADDLVGALFCLLEIHTPERRGRAADLLRQMVRVQYEHCAQIAENWVVEHDPYEELDGMQIGDAIAERMRTAAEERTTRLLQDTMPKAT